MIEWYHIKFNQNHKVHLKFVFKCVEHKKEVPEYKSENGGWLDVMEV